MSLTLNWRCMVGFVLCRMFGGADEGGNTLARIFQWKLSKNTFCYATGVMLKPCLGVWSPMKNFRTKRAWWTKLDHRGNCKDWAIFADSWSNPQKKTLGSGNLNEKIKKQRGEARGSGGEAGGSGGKRGEAGGSGGKRGEAGGSRGEAGGSGGKRGKRGGSGEKGGGKRGKNGVKGICAIFSSKRDFEPFCSFFRGLLWFCVCVPVLDRLGMVFSNLAFWPSKTVFCWFPARFDFSQVD